MRHYTTLLFDADGTLLDFDVAERNALSTTFAQAGYPYDDTIYRRYLSINKGLWDAYEEGTMSREDIIYSRFGILFSELNIADDGIAFEDRYQKALGRGHDTIPYAMEILSYLHKDFDLYIATNGVVDTQYQRLAESGLHPYFKDVFVSEELGWQKPSMEYFACCFAHIKEEDKGNILMIGDSLSSDMLGGIQAGIDTCWYNPKQKENVKQLAITYEITDLRELYNITGKEQNNE